MATKKKPWPTIITGGGTGRFTPEQIREAVRTVKEKSERKAAGLAGKRTTEEKMPTKKKPWRTVIVAGDTGRFTWEQIDDAITKAIARREAREAKAARAAQRVASEASELPAEATADTRKPRGRRRAA